MPLALSLRTCAPQIFHSLRKHSVSNSLVEWSMQSFPHMIQTIVGVFLDAITFMRLCCRPTAAVAVENLFLRKQLGLFIERQAKPRHATDAIRFTLARLSHWFEWRNALVVVKADTLIHWHRKGFRLF